MLATDFRTSFKWRLQEGIFSYIIPVFVMVILGIFFIFPVGMLVLKSFVGPTGFTLEYFRLLFQNQLHTTAIVNSLQIGLYSTLTATLISIPLALIHVKCKFKGKGFLFGVILLPMIMPPFVGAIGIQQFFSLYGAINLFLISHNIIATPIPWLENNHSFYIVILLEALHLYPILYLNLTAALSNIDPSLEEMADLFGVSKLRKLTSILLPLATPGFIAGATVVFIWSFTDLGTPLLVGYHEVVPVRIFNMVTDIQENPMGFALVFIVILLTMLFFGISRLTLRNTKKYEMMAKGHVTEPAKSTSFFSTVLIYIFCIFVLFFALFPHLSVLLKSVSENWFMTAFPEKFTLEHYTKIFVQELPFIGIKNSLFYSSISTLFDLVFGVAIAYLLIRKKLPFGSLFESIVMLPLAIPGIVLAFGYIVAFSNTPLDPLSNPVPLLIISYGIRRLPYMVRSATAGLQQTHISLEESSSLFGASRAHTLRKVIAPILTANLIAGSLLCFSYAMLDVSDSLLLAMKEQFFPITKSIYTLYLEQGNGDVTASALGMFVMVLLGGAILVAANILGKKLGELFRS